jgi:hypothetical protein
VPACATLAAGLLPRRGIVISRGANASRSYDVAMDSSDFSASCQTPNLMTEDYFWEALEFRLCDEFAGLRQRDKRKFWCDGIHPVGYMLDGRSPRIIGRCWICQGQDQSEWKFVLLLPRRFASRDEIDWASLLPPDNMTRWLAFDEGRRYIEIEPAVAVPDLEE